MTAPEPVEVQWGYHATCTALLLEDEPMAAAWFEKLERDAVQHALEHGYEPVEGVTITRRVEPLSEVGVAMAAKVDAAEPGDEFYGQPADVIEAEVARRETAARQVRDVLLEFPVRAKPDPPGLRQLTPESAGEVYRQGLENARRADESGLVCGQPEMRHDFGVAADLLRDGRVPAAGCRRCGRDVGRDELLEQARLEADGVRWWEPDTASSASRQHHVDTGRYLTLWETRRG